MGSEKRKRIVWHLEVSAFLNNQLEGYVASSESQFQTKSEFIRQAVREALRKHLKEE